MSIPKDAAVVVSGPAAYREVWRGKVWRFLALAVVLGLITLLAVTMGSADIGLGDILAMLWGRWEGARAGAKMHILWNIRLPRVVFGLVGGFGLALAGTVMQAVLRNALASSYTLGVSSAAGFGAALAIGLGWGLWGGKFLIIGNAFFFGLLSMALVYGIATLKGARAGTLILAGIAISYLFSALIALVKYLVQHDVLAGIVFWLLGGLHLASWENVTLLLPIVFLPSLWLMLQFPWDLNVLSAGDEVATSLGVHPERTRIMVLILAALITSGIVAFAGVIGFVCLVGPHMARLIIGSDHRYLLPFAGFTGAILLLGADTVGRTLIQPTELPVGIVTALLGVPFFLHLLLRSRGYWE
jgi:iron complex transport system permease protein